VSPRGESGRELVAVIVGAGRGAAARAAFEAGRPVPLRRGGRHQPRIGDLATVLLRGRSAEVTEIHGPADRPGPALEALLADAGKWRGFPRAVEREAAEIPEEGGGRDPGRRDLTEQGVLTIDPEGAKDHDDAIHVEREGDALRLFVHIADVSRYVPPGGPLDREAARRGNSVYVPGAVVPMLPERLSSDLCSLRPGVPRDVVTAELVIDAEGEVRERRLGRSRIRSRRRLTYPEVDAVLAGGAIGPEVDGAIRLAAEVAERLGARRRRRGALAVSSGEPRFVLSEERVESAEVETETPAHSLVEQCMVAANEAVAEHLIARGQPTVFRYHEDPAGRPVERLYDQLEELGVPLEPLPDEHLGPVAAREAAAAAAVSVRAHARAIGAEAAGRALSGLVLRSLRQAYYSHDHVGHSGLASPAYAHFTSPIRRYPDLLVHRGLLDTIGLGDPGPSATECAEAAVTSSETEREAAALERRADSICAALLLERQLGERERPLEVEGTVTGAIDGGLFVAFDEVFDGFLPARRLGGDYWRLHPLEVGLVGDTTGRRVMIGDPLRARVVRIEALRGRVELEPAELGESRRLARRRVVPDRSSARPPGRS